MRDRYFANCVTDQRGRLVCEGETCVVVETADAYVWVWPLRDCEECR